MRPDISSVEVVIIFHATYVLDHSICIGWHQRSSSVFLLNLLSQQAGLTPRRDPGTVAMSQID